MHSYGKTQNIDLDELAFFLASLNWDGLPREDVLVFAYVVLVTTLMTSIMVLLSAELRLITAKAHAFSPQ